MRPFPKISQKENVTRTVAVCVDVLRVRVLFFPPVCFSSVQLEVISLINDQRQMREWR